MPHTSSAPSSARDHQLHAIALVGFRRISRRALVIATVALSMMLVVVHDLPAAAAPAAAPASPIGSQALAIDSRLVASPFTEPFTTARDDFSVSLFTPVQWPVDPSTHISSYFGRRAAPCAGCSTFHAGMDFTPGYGAPVAAIADGVVVALPLSELGSYVVVRHVVDGVTIDSVYGHLVARSGLPVGTQVVRGQTIGLAGNTGPTSGPHLHFAILSGGSPIDPLAWMRAHVTQAWGE
ncbi:M23 family metallopeptidase [Protaetiibacter larvae]|uniref:M23 family metallopeptidase n=1 Tax=Protaetiibacter larvae TaxID=2592654 RepID=A0A5C1YCE2_9MICO|nr:M23 family metallopeptidase [Protaetiibacter larvae]QEO10502.1 M23 family metallopeptidase [Protaetiibacter larvae]